MMEITPRIILDILQTIFLIIGTFTIYQLYKKFKGGIIGRTMFSMLIASILFLAIAISHDVESFLYGSSKIELDEVLEAALILFGVTVLFRFKVDLNKRLK